VTNRHYELMARFVDPHFQKSRDGLRARYDYPVTPPAELWVTPGIRFPPFKLQSPDEPPLPISIVALLRSGVAGQDEWW
jgi:hypothetical protein